MTEKAKGKRVSTGRAAINLSGILTVISLFVMLTASEALSDGARRGLVLTAGTILPSIFPFMILGDFISCYISGSQSGVTERLMCRILNASRREYGIMVSGLLCGFPASARASSAAAKKGTLSKERAVTVAALSSNPSPPFIIGAVGTGLLSDRTTGIIILASMLISVIIASRIFAENRHKSDNDDIITGQKYNFVESVRGAGAAAVTVFAFITFFCALIELLKHIIGEGVLFSFALPFIEVSTALVHLITKCNLPKELTHMLIGFSIGFGGLSANLQCAAFLSEAGVKLKKFFLIKLLLGAICAAVTTALLALRTSVLLAL